jgi:phage shock protein PspC (stress-responsive transcriptional regulator)
MKKTVSIQISGMLFHVDDDAYARLEQYLQSIRDHFAHLADKDEIVSDIESRIAEKFSEKMKKNKQTITLGDVETLIQSMGTVEDFEAFEADTEQETAEEKKATEDDRTPPRRFYRNPDDKVVAGVASGIASYFNIDPVIVRVIFAVLALMHGVGVVAYFILWFAMPLAKTHSQRMEMQGQPMTLSGLEKKIQRSTLTFPTETFTSVYTRGGIKLNVREGKECKVAARGSPHHLRTMDIHVVDGQLRLERVNGPWFGWIFHGFQHMSFDITMPTLQEVDIAGACSVDINGFDDTEITLRAVGACKLNAHTNAKILHVHVEAASSAKISGTGKEIFVTAIGASSLNARAFTATQAHADVSGASSAHISASETVDGQANGASSLCVYGSPTVTVKTAGASSVKTKDGTMVADDKEWQADVTYDDHKKYTESASPALRFARGIGRIMRTFFFTIFRIIGAVMLALGGIGVVILIITAVQTWQTGMIPYLHIPVAAPDSILEYLWFALIAFIVFVPTILLMTFGSALIHLKKQFNVPGMITFCVFWIIAIVAAIFMSGILFPDLHHNATGPTITQTFGAQNFDAISAADSDNVNVKIGSGFSVKATGPTQEINRIHVRLQKNTLIIEHTNSHSICLACNLHAVTFDITMPMLTTLTADGWTRASIQGFSGSSLTIQSTGLSHVSVSGATDLLTLDASDLSSIDATNLLTTDASVLLRDFSHADASVSASIKGETHDCSRLIYSGQAVSDIHSSDLSKVTSSSTDTH